MADLRMPNLNVVLLAGRLVQDPDFRYTPSGVPVARLRIASDRPYRDQAGEWQRETLFIDVIAWRALAERMQNQVRKGSPVLVEGYLRSRSWETEEGLRRSTVEVVARKIQVLEKAGEPGMEVSADVLDEEEPDEELPF